MGSRMFGGDVVEHWECGEYGIGAQFGGGCGVQCDPSINGKFHGVVRMTYMTM